MLEALLAHFRVPAGLGRPAPPTADLHPCTPGEDCDDCPNQDAGGPTLPLCLLRQGERAHIIHVDQARRFRKRLADLGLAAGMDVRVLRASYARGPLILAVRQDARLAIRWEMANRILVRRERDA